MEEPGVTYLELEDLDMDIIDEDAEEDGLPPPPDSSKADLGEVEAKRLQMLKEVRRWVGCVVGGGVFFWGGDGRLPALRSRAWPCVSRG